jgi:hypothetical protein
MKKYMLYGCAVVVALAGCSTRQQGFASACAAPIL